MARAIHGRGEGRGGSELLIFLCKMNNDQNLDGNASTRQNANRQRELTFVRPRQSCPAGLGKLRGTGIGRFASFRAALTLVHQCDGVGG